jgi:hypothetical protein
MLSSTPEKTKEIANSITHLCYNLIGYLPSPFLYGLVCKYTGGVKSRYGLAFILLWSYFGVGFLFLAKYYKANSGNKKEMEGSPFKSDNKDESTDFSEANKNIEEKTGALRALYGRFSSI